MRVLSGKQLRLKHQIPFGRLALKIYCVLSFMEDVGKCLDPGNEIAGGGGKTNLGFIVDCCWKWKWEPGRWAVEGVLVPCTGQKAAAGGILSQDLGE